MRLSYLFFFFFLLYNVHFISCEKAIEYNVETRASITLVKFLSFFLWKAFEELRGDKLLRNYFVKIFRKLFKLEMKSFWFKFKIFCIFFKKIWKFFLLKLFYFFERFFIFLEAFFKAFNFFESFWILSKLFIFFLKGLNFFKACFPFKKILIFNFLKFLNFFQSYFLVFLLKFFFWVQNELVQSFKNFYPFWSSRENLKLLLIFHTQPLPLPSFFFAETAQFSPLSKHFYDNLKRQTTKSYHSHHKTPSEYFFFILDTKIKSIMLIGSPGVFY